MEEVKIVFNVLKVEDLLVISNLLDELDCMKNMLSAIRKRGYTATS